MGAVTRRLIRENCDGAYTVTVPDELYSKHRLVRISGPIDDALADSVIDQLILLAREDDTKPIEMFINSPGGSVTAGLAIFDTMDAIAPPVHTIAAGEAASMAAVLFIGGAKNARMMLPHSRLLLHDPLISGLGATSALDLSAKAEDLMKIRNSLIDIISLKTMLTISEVKELTKQDTYLSAEEAIAKGMADSLLTAIS